MIYSQVERISLLSEEAELFESVIWKTGESGVGGCRGCGHGGRAISGGDARRRTSSMVVHDLCGSLSPGGRGDSCRCVRLHRLSQLGHGGLFRQRPLLGQILLKKVEKWKIGE